MARLLFINKAGKFIDLLSSQFYILKDFDGLTETAVSLSTSSIPTMDGVNVNNAVVGARKMAFVLQIKDAVTVEDAKRHILDVIKPKLESRIQFIQKDRSMTIDGVVENIEMPRFSDKVFLTIGFFCTSPFWKDDETKINTIKQFIDVHYFGEDQLFFTSNGVVLGEFSQSLTRRFENTGDVSTGVKIILTAIQEITNPRVINTNNNRFIGFNITMQPNDELIITTHKGAKTAKVNGVSVLDTIMSGSSFLQLDVGEQEFTITSEENGEGMFFTMEYNQLYV